ncbi:MAG: preprotein translocase subunit YajC [Planctomycetota bacterium]
MDATADALALPAIPLTLAFQDGSPLAGDQPAGSETTGEAGTVDPAAGAGGPPPRQGIGPFEILLFGGVAFMLVLIFTSGRKAKREQRERQQMLDALARNDKVQTIGGIIGTVAEIRTDEVILKADDSGQTKIKVSRSAIQQVLSSRSTGKSEAEAESDA